MKLHASVYRLECLTEMSFNKGQKSVGERVAELSVGDDARILEERCGSDTFSAIDDLIGEHEVSWTDLLSKRSDGGKGDNKPYTQRLECGDVGSSGHARRWDRVTNTMSGQESN